MKAAFDLAIHQGFFTKQLQHIIFEIWEETVGFVNKQLKVIKDALNI